MSHTFAVLIGLLYKKKKHLKLLWLNCIKISIELCFNEFNIAADDDSGAIETYALYSGILW